MKVKKGSVKKRDLRNYDYQPQKLAFKNIFTIAAGIWEFPNEIFPNNTSEEKKRWKMLTGILQDMRLKPIIDIEWSELDLISDRCFSCKNVATKLVEEHYEKLKAKLLENTIEKAK